MDPLEYIQQHTKQLNDQKHHGKKVRLAVVWGVLAVVLVVASFLIVKRMPAPTKLDNLHALEKSSQPVTATVEERGGGLDTLGDKSAAVKSSNADRINALQALSQ